MVAGGRNARGCLGRLGRGIYIEVFTTTEGPIEICNDHQHIANQEGDGSLVQTVSVRRWSVNNVTYLNVCSEGNEQATLDTEVIGTEDEDGVNNTSQGAEDAGAEDRE